MAAPGCGHCDRPLGRDRRVVGDRRASPAVQPCRGLERHHRIQLKQQRALVGAARLAGWRQHRVEHAREPCVGPGAAQLPHDLAGIQRVGEQQPDAIGERVSDAIKHIPVAHPLKHDANRIADRKRLSVGLSVRQQLGVRPGKAVGAGAAAALDADRQAIGGCQQQTLAVHLMIR
jgi:hypothetical protein